MTAFRGLLVGLLIALTVYTAITISQHGLNLLPVFFGDIAAMAWPGQFNLDFLGFLILSGLWTAWRHGFTGPGLALGLVAFFGGILFLSAYLLYLSVRTGGDIKAMMLGVHGTA